MPHVDMHRIFELANDISEVTDTNYGPRTIWDSSQTSPAKYEVYGGSHVAGPARNLASKTGGMWHSSKTSGERGVTITFEYKGTVLIPHK